jgi:hypothetical protein
VPIADVSALSGFSTIPIIVLKVIITSGESLLMAQDRYHIRVKGHLSPQWTDWFDGFTITNNEEGEALLSGIILDQAALYGLLNKISNLGLPLLSVNRVESEKAPRGTSDMDR